MRILVLTLMMSFLSHSVFGAEESKITEGGGAAKEAEGSDALQVPANPTTMYDFLKCLKNVGRKKKTIQMFKKYML